MLGKAIWRLRIQENPSAARAAANRLVRGEGLAGPLPNNPIAPLSALRASPRSPTSTPKLVATPLYAPGPPRPTCGNTIYVMYACPCWPASTTNQSGLVTLGFDILTLKVVSESCDVGYLCANYFGLPVHRCSLFSSYSRCTRQTSDRQTDVRRQTDAKQTASYRLMPPERWHNNLNAVIVKRNWKLVSSELKHYKNYAYYQKNSCKLYKIVESNGIGSDIFFLFGML